jgi:di/tricarboxylate transporter
VNVLLIVEYIISINSTIIGFFLFPMEYHIKQRHIRHIRHIRHNRNIRHIRGFIIVTIKCEF